MNAASRYRALCDPAFAGLLGTNFVLGLTSAFIVPFGSLWATQEIGMSARTLGLFMTINSLSAIVLSTFLARWSDSGISRRKLLFIGSLAGMLGNIGFASARDPVVLTLIGSSLMAIASINFAQLFAYVREDLGRGEQGAADAPFMMGVLRAFYALAWTIGPLIGGRIVTRFGYLAIFLAAAALFVVFALFVFVFVAERPPELSLRPNEPLTWGLGQPSVLAHCVAFGLMFAAFTLNTLNLPLFLTQKLGATEQGVGTAFAISPLFEMLFMVWFGHIAASGRQKRVIVFGVAAATCYFLTLRFVTAAWHVYPMQVLNAAAVAVTTSVVIPYFQDLLPRQAGVATSLYSNALKVGGLVGFSAFGLLALELGNTGLFLVCAGLSATTLVIVSFTRARRR